MAPKPNSEIVNFTLQNTTKILNETSHLSKNKRVMANAHENDPIPLLDLESIISAIAEVSDGNVTVTAEELKKLKPQRAISIYKALLFYYAENASEQLNQAQCNISGSFMYPRIYEEATNLCNFVIVLDKAMKGCCINDFSMKDLLVPKPKRTHRLLSAFINRVQFQNSRFDLVVNAYKKSEDMKQANLELEERKEILINRIAESKKKRTEDQRQIAEITDEVENIRKQHNDKMIKLEAQKKNAAQLAEVVESKERISDMLQMQDELDACDAVAMEKASLLNGLNFKERVLIETEEDAKTALKLITNLVSHLKKHAATIKSLDEAKDRVRTQEQSFKDLVAIFQNMKRQENSKHEKITRISVQHKKHMTSTLEAIELEKKKRSTLKSDVIMKIRNRLNEIETEERAISEELDEGKTDFDRKMKNATEAYGQILDQLDIFHHSLTKSWEMTTPFFDAGRKD